MLAVFFPIGFALGKFNFDLKVFARSFVGLSNEYNNEWWYVKQYIKILIMLPVIDYIYVMISKYIREKKYFIPVLTCGGVLISLCIPISRYVVIVFARHVGLFSFVMISGYISAKMKMHEILYALFDNAKILPFIISAIIVILRTIMSPNPLDTQIDWMIAPIFVISVSYIIRSCPSVVNTILRSLGKYSMFMWLIHTFFIYYYFQPVIMAPRVLSLIYFMLIAVSLGIAVMFERVSTYLIEVYGRSNIGRFLQKESVR